MSRRFDKVLVANRGEIALRVIRAARELGLSTVAVYSTADRDSLHVKFADEAVCIGPPSPKDSYLSIPALIAAAEISAAQAIHPGYGFLAESAELAQTCARSGFTFVGPSPEAIRLMGNKIAGRRAMAEHGLPSLPGSEGAIESPEEAHAVAEQIGFPVIIKAAAGGGGRGMRIVREAKAFEQALATTQREAKAAFGDGSVYVERFIERPRHIEIQIAADEHGQVVHLGERECSVQRRYQKIIEEAPSPALTEAGRAEIGARVVNAVKALGYTSLGTVELIRDEDGSLYFMEMNTRVQVEHPVTEMLVRRDLVRLQLSIAQGEPLPFSQDDVHMEGHALECRINAEHPETFAPSRPRSSPSTAVDGASSMIFW